MTTEEFIETNNNQSENGLHPVFIIRNIRGQIVGEYDPGIIEEKWAGSDYESAMKENVLSWRITRDQQDMDVVQF